MESSRLKNRQYYIDLYDKHTVDLCRRIEKPRERGTVVLGTDEDSDEADYAHAEKIATTMSLYFETGERYLNKEKTIQKWMDDDRKRDELYESAQAPEGIRCLTCRNRVTSTFKILWDELDKEDRILFMYDCPKK